MTINFYANKESLDRLKMSKDIEVIYTEEEVDELMTSRSTDELHTTCACVMTYLKSGDILHIFDSTGHFTVTFDGKYYTTTPRRTYKELRTGHNLEKIWRGGGFCSEIKEGEDNE